MSYVYLASPYSHTEVPRMQERYEQTMGFVAHMMKQGEVIFSPILHCHEMAVKFGLPRTAEYWRKYNTQMQRYARELWLLRLVDWDQSVGVAQELQYADRLGQPIREFW